jgi:hypothetical protein
MDPAGFVAGSDGKAIGKARHPADGVVRFTRSRLLMPGSNRPRNCRQRTGRHIAVAAATPLPQFEQPACRI